MPKDTAPDAMVEALDHLLEVQEHQGTILTHLEQREVPDMHGLMRRLEEVADAIERLQPVERPTRPRWLLPGAVLLAVIGGWALCWLTVRWLPSAVLPPGFSRVAPVQQKGRF